MADTIAKLIFQADTKELEKADKLLKNITKSARGAENAAKKKTDTDKKSSKATQDNTKKTNQNTKAKQNNKKASDSSSKGNDKLANSFRNASNASATLLGPLNGVSGRLSFVATGLSRVGVVGLAFGATMAGLGIAAQRSVAAFAEMESQVLKIEAVLRATDNQVGMTSQSIQDFARELGVATLGSGAEFREAAAVLLTYGNITEDVFKRAMVAAGDMSAVVGGSASANVQKLGRLLEDPVNNLTALRRAGVQFSAQERDLIDTLKLANKEFEIQDLILDKVEKKLGGAGAAAGTGVAGAYDGLGESMDHLLETFAEAARTSGAATQWAVGWTGVFDNLTAALKKFEEGTRTSGEQYSKNFMKNFLASFGSSSPIQQEIDNIIFGAQPSKPKKAPDTSFDISRIPEPYAIGEGGDGGSSGEARVAQEDLVSTRLLEIELKRSTASLLIKQGEMEAASILTLQAAKQENQLQMERLNAEDGAIREHNEIKRQLADQLAQENHEKVLDEIYFFESNERIKTELLQAAELERSEFMSEARMLELEALLAQADLEYEAKLNKYGLSEEALELHEANKDAIVTKYLKETEDATKKSDKIMLDGKKRALGAALNLLSGFAGKNAALQKALIVVQTGVALANNARATAENMILARTSQLSLPTPDAPARAAAAMTTEKIIGGINAAAIIASGAGQISSAGGGGGGGATASSIASSAPVQFDTADSVSVQEPSIVNVSVDGTIDPEGARRIIEAINEATEDGLEINAMVV